MKSKRLGRPPNIPTKENLKNAFSDLLSHPNDIGHLQRFSSRLLNYQIYVALQKNENQQSKIKSEEQLHQASTNEEALPKMRNSLDDLDYTEEEYSINAGADLSEVRKNIGGNFPFKFFS